MNKRKKYFLFKKKVFFLHPSWRGRKKWEGRRGWCWGSSWQCVSVTSWQGLYWLFRRNFFFFFHTLLQVWHWGDRGSTSVPLSVLRSGGQAIQRGVYRQLHPHRRCDLFFVLLSLHGRIWKKERSHPRLLFQISCGRIVERLKHSFKIAREEIRFHPSFTVLISSAVLLIIGCTTASASFSYSTLIVGRSLIGLGVGTASTGARGGEANDMLSR